MDGLVKAGRRYYFRRRVPKDLVCVLGRREIKRSLGTTRRTEAVRRVRVVAAEIETEFTEMRMEQRLTPRRMKALVGRYYQASLEGAERVRSSDLPDDEAGGYPAGFWQDHTELLAGSTSTPEGVDKVAEVHELLRGHARELLSTGRPGQIPGLTEAAGALLAAEGIEVDRDGPDYVRLVRELAKVSADVHGIEAERTRGDFVSDIEDRAARRYVVPEPAAAPVPEHPQAEPGPLLSEALDRFLRPRQGVNLTPETADRYRADVGLFMELAGDRPAEEYHQRDVRDYRDALLRLPANRKTGRYRDRSLAELLEAEVPAEHRMSARTVNLRRGRVAALFGWLAAEGDIPRVIGQGLALPAADRKRRPFSDGDIGLLFGELLPFERTRPYAAWLPLLALFSGCRMGELIQLRPADVRTVGGVVCLDVQTEQDEDQDEGRRVKNKSSRRLVPVHNFLLQVGFLRWVEKKQKRGDRFIFSIPTKDPRKYYTNQFMALRDKLLSPKNKVFHSFRHTFQNTLKQAGVTLDVVHDIVGHAPVNKMDKHYMEPYEIKIMADAMKKLGSFGLDAKTMKRKYRIFL